MKLLLMKIYGILI